MLKLRNAENALANFFAQGVLRLGPKLGPILWQFSPDFRFEAERIETFLASLPRDTAAALEIARHHDRRVRHGTWLAIDGARVVWSLASLFTGRVRVDVVAARRIDVMRAPLP